MKNSLAVLARGLLDLIVPPICWSCRQATNGEPFCPACTAQLVGNDTPTCPRCASSLTEFTAAANVCPRCMAESFSFDAAIRFGPYDGLHREIVLRMKQSHGEVLAEAVGPIFARNLLPKVKAYVPQLVIPIPLHWRRHWRRGYNPSGILAVALGRELGLTVANGAIRRTRNTVYQTACRNFAERKANVRGAFAPGRHVELTGKTILLVDDVLTTGATAHEASRVLKKLGAKSVVMAVFAHESPQK